MLRQARRHDRSARPSQFGAECIERRCCGPFRKSRRNFFERSGIQDREAHSKRARSFACHFSSWGGASFARSGRSTGSNLFVFAVHAPHEAAKEAREFGARSQIQVPGQTGCRVSEERRQRRETQCLLDGLGRQARPPTIEVGAEEGPFSIFLALNCSSEVLPKIFHAEKGIPYG